jgi:CHAT domain
LTPVVLAVVAKGGMLSAANDLIVLPEGWALQAVPEARGYFEFGLNAVDLPGWHEPEAVRRRGERVREALRQHAPLGRLLDLVSGTVAPERRPLLLRLAAGVAEMLPWEALCGAKGEFMALDPRWPIVRVSDALDGQPPRPLALRPPVRLLALISARGIERQQAEFSALWAAVGQARQAGLPVTLQVLTGDAGTRAAVQAAIAEGASGLSVGGIPATPTELIQDIRAAAPNLLHFFCHGQAGDDGTEQALELATANGLLADDGSGLVRLKTSRLVELMAALPSPWLLTLNCCLGGAGSAEMLSIAHQAVGASGATCPAAVAMTEPVDALDAHRFAKAFYRVLLGDIASAHARLQGAGAPASTEFDLAPAMREARRALCEAHEDEPASAREWVLPVLYVRGTAPLLFERAQALPEAQVHAYEQRARLIADALRQMRETLDEAGRTRLLQDTLAGVPETYWPDADGNFNR